MTWRGSTRPYRFILPSPPTPEPFGNVPKVIKEIAG